MKRIMRIILVILGIPFLLFGTAIGFIFARSLIGVVYGMESARFGIRGIIDEKFNIKIG